MLSEVVLLRENDRDADLERLPEITSVVVTEAVLVRLLRLDVRLGVRTIDGLTVTVPADDAVGLPVKDALSVRLPEIDPDGEPDIESAVDNVAEFDDELVNSGVVDFDKVREAEALGVITWDAELVGSSVTDSEEVGVITWDADLVIAKVVVGESLGVTDVVAEAAGEMLRLNVTDGESSDVFVGVTMSLLDVVDERETAVLEMDNVKD